MKTYIIGLKGISPLVFNTRQKNIDEEIAKLKKNQFSEWESKNWKKKAIRDKKGNVIIPVIWIKSAFVNACKHSRIVPNFATSKKETYTRYAEALYFQNSTFKCSEKDLVLLESYMGAQGAGSKTKVLKCYPKIDEWTTTIELKDPSGRMSKEEMKTLFEYAGMFEGIGDFRKVNHGRFEVVSIKEIK